MGEGTTLHSLKTLSRSCSRTELQIWWPGAFHRSGSIAPLLNPVLTLRRLTRKVVLRGCWQGFGNWKLICIVAIVAEVNNNLAMIHQNQYGLQKENKSIQLDIFANMILIMMKKSFVNIYHETHLNSTQCILLTALTFAFPRRRQTGYGCRRQHVKVPAVQKSPGVSVCLLLHHPEFGVGTCG